MVKNNILREKKQHVIGLLCVGFNALLVIIRISLLTSEQKLFLLKFWIKVYFTVLLKYALKEYTSVWTECDVFAHLLAC